MHTKSFYMLSPPTHTTDIHIYVHTYICMHRKGDTAREQKSEREIA